MRTRLHQIVAEKTDRQAGMPAITFKHTTLTYAELWRDAAGCAAGLRRLGLERGERVGIYLDKRIETVVSVLGA
jgi:acyl-CoA synthetase (AMP-forming)/AMP-acid ligase II